MKHPQGIANLTIKIGEAVVSLIIIGTITATALEIKNKIPKVKALIVVGNVSLV